MPELFPSAMLASPKLFTLFPRSKLYEPVLLTAFPWRMFSLPLVFTASSPIKILLLPVRFLFPLPSAAMPSPSDIFILLPMA